MAERSVTVRPGKATDADAIFALVRQLAVTYQSERQSFDENLPRLLGRDSQLLLVATEENVVVGYVMASESVTLYANGPTTELMELVVDVDRRGHGIGRPLVEAVVGWAREHGCTEVNVPSRRSGEYYMRLGFGEAARRYRLRL